MRLNKHFFKMEKKTERLIPQAMTVKNGKVIEQINLVSQLAQQVEKYLIENKIPYHRKELFFGEFEISFSFNFIESPFLIVFDKRGIRVFSRAVTKCGSGFRAMSPETFLAFFNHLK